MEMSQSRITNINGGLHFQPEDDVIIHGDAVGRDKVIKNILPAPPQPEPGRYYPQPRGAFIGRRQLLDRLHAALTSTQPGMVGRVALVGMSGAGKTRLALEYALRHQADYPDGIYLVQAAENWPEQMAQKAQEVGLFPYGNTETDRRRYLFFAFLRFLNAHPRSLLILDDVRDWRSLWSGDADGFSLAEFQCRVLLTSSLYEAQLPCEVLQVGLFAPDEARHLLLKVLGLPQASGDENAAAICELLGHLPLAIVMAAAYLNEYSTAVALADYRARLEEEGSLQALAPIVRALRLQWQGLRSQPARQVLKVLALLGQKEGLSRAHLALAADLPDTARRGYAAPLETALTPLRKLALIEEMSALPSRAHLSAATSALPPQPKTLSDLIRLHTLVQEFVQQEIVADEGIERFLQQVEDNLARALASTPDPERIITIGECLLLRPAWQQAAVRDMLFKKLLALLDDARVPLTQRHRGALLLADLHWLDAPGVVLAPDASLNYLEFIARYIVRDTERQYLEGYLNRLLDEQSQIPMSNHDRARLLVQRAALRGQLRNFSDSEADYKEAWRYAASDDRLAARIKLGLANLTKSQYARLIESAASDERQPGEAGLRNAIQLYEEAESFARRYGQDPILLGNILQQTAYTYALLGDWEPALRCCEEALQAVGQIEDETLRLINVIRVQETESQVHLQHGLRLRAAGDPEALGAFQLAYEMILVELHRLAPFSADNYDYLLALYNAGECLVERSRCPNCQTPKLDLTRAFLERARDLAHRYRVTEIEEDAADLLGELSLKAPANLRGDAPCCG